MLGHWDPGLGIWDLGSGNRPPSSLRPTLEDDAEPLHAAVERLPRDAEGVGGARDAAVRVEQSQLDLFPLQRNVFFGGAGTEGEVVGRDLGAARGGRGARDPVLE